MLNSHSHRSYELFCEELKDQGFLFEVWRMAREGEHADRDFKDRFWDKLNHVARKYPEVIAKLVPESDPDDQTGSAREEPEGREPPQGPDSRSPNQATQPDTQTTYRFGSKRCQVLQCLHKSGPLRQAAISKLTGIQVTSLYNLVDDMKGNGLISKIKQPEPGKSLPVTYIELTDKGRTELENITQANDSNSD